MNQENGALFFDFSSAFNTIQPQLLQDNLTSMAVDPYLMSWIMDYLTDRPHSTGTPQGTMLSPLLFASYTSDFKHDSDTCHIQKYSDDTAIQWGLRKTKFISSYGARHDNRSDAIVDIGVNANKASNNVTSQHFKLLFISLKQVSALLERSPTTLSPTVLSPTVHTIETVSVPRPFKVNSCKFKSFQVQRKATGHPYLIKIKTRTSTAPVYKTITCGLLNIRSLSSKAILINDIISYYHIDLFCLTETWLSEDEYFSLNEVTPPSHLNYQIPRVSGRGGGVASIFNSSLELSPKPKIIFNSFDSLSLSLSNPIRKLLQPLLFVIIYRRPGPYSDFLSEFADFLTSLILKTGKVIIVGDFNIHVDDSNDSLSRNGFLLN
ncbi:uncharacterized protein [Antennarius striatus]|uniref:uncharacterized protein n=1 Tax=Antennarius striatus TaxID=241820 RepID=UPI0035B4969A